MAKQVSEGKKKRTIKKAEKKTEQAQQQACSPSDKYIIVDYPQENEIITSNTYAIRIGSSEGKNVEISIDGGPWQACRLSNGYWWFDWGEYPGGRHVISARIVDDKGKAVKKTARCCEYCC